jgi:hypothetical protein
MRVQGDAADDDSLLPEARYMSRVPGMFNLRTHRVPTYILDGLYTAWSMRTYIPDGGTQTSCAQG